MERTYAMDTYSETTMKYLQNSIATGHFFVCFLVAQLVKRV